MITARLVPLRGRIHRLKPMEPAPPCAGPGGRFPAIWPRARNSARKGHFRAIVFGMPVSPIVRAIGSDGRAETGSGIGSPSSRVLHELSRLEGHAHRRKTESA